jgi:peroxiredoxin Q/BCP
MRIFCLFISFLSLASACFYSNAVFAQAIGTQDSKKVEYGLARGDMLPENIKGVDHLGRDVDLSSFIGRNGLVVYFVRSIEWSPHCIFQLEEVSRSGSSITNMGYNIAVVSYEPPEKLKLFSDKYDFPYFLVSDEGSKIIKSFGLFNTDFAKGTSYYGIPYPSVYIIQTDGMIVGKFFDIDYKRRPSLYDVTEYLRFLQTGAEISKTKQE